MNFEKIVDALEHVVGAFDALQEEGPAGPKVIAAVNNVRAAIADAKTPQADDAGGAIEEAPQITDDTPQQTVRPNFG